MLLQPDTIWSGHRRVEPDTCRVQITTEHPPYEIMSILSSLGFFAVSVGAFARAACWVTLIVGRQYGLDHWGVYGGLGGLDVCMCVGFNNLVMF